MVDMSDNGDITYFHRYFRKKDMGQKEALPPLYQNEYTDFLDFSQPRTIPRKEAPADTTSQCPKLFIDRITIRSRGRPSLIRNSRRKLAAS